MSIKSFAAAVTLVLAGMGTSLAQGLQPQQISLEDMKQLKWNISPNGTSQAAVVGDPTKPGIYVMISKFPAGLRTPVHTHPDDRIVTVLSGTSYSGYGLFDEKTVKALPAGSVLTEPAGQPHYTWAKDGEVVLYIVGHGPSATSPFKPAAQ